MENTDSDIHQVLKEQIAAAAGKNQLAALPKRLSPSRASDFKKCPQLFYFKTICGISTPGSEATLRGTLAHAAFERIFDHPAGERTPELAISYIRPAWEEMINPNLEGLNEREQGYALEKQQQARDIIAPGSEAEEALFAAAADCVYKWFDMERVNNFSPTDLELPNGNLIDGRELYVKAKLSGIDVHGYIDRLDRYITPAGDVRWTVTDYKTSAVAPWKKKAYPPHTVERIRQEAFFQLKVYAVLAWKLLDIRVSMLRLVYVGNGDREEGIGSMAVTQAVIDETIAELESTWRQIRTAARTQTWKPQTGPLCQWCYFQSVCPAWATPDTDVSEMLPEVVQQ